MMNRIFGVLTLMSVIGLGACDTDAGIEDDVELVPAAEEMEVEPITEMDPLMNDSLIDGRIDLDPEPNNPEPYDTESLETTP